MVQTSFVNIPLIIIAGPTASGKSDLAIKLAEQYFGEIINADSQQVYQGLTIGTGKIDWQHQQIPHHLFDILTPNQVMNAGHYAKLADEIILKIHQQKKIPFLVGGTGLYLKSLLFGLDQLPPRNEAIRSELNEKIANEGLAALYEQFKRIDPSLANKINGNDSVRIIRNMEIYLQTGCAPSTLFTDAKKARYPHLFFVLNPDRERLHQNIAKRVAQMLEQGWIEEVQQLLTQGYAITSIASRAIGYQEVYEYINGKLSKKDCLEKIITQTRQYARRQIIWFRKQVNVIWVDPYNSKMLEQLNQKMLDIISTKTQCVI